MQKYINSRLTTEALLCSLFTLTSGSTETATFTECVLYVVYCIVWFIENDEWTPPLRDVMLYATSSRLTAHCRCQLGHLLQSS